MIPPPKANPNSEAAEPADEGSDFVVNVAFSWGVTFAIVTVISMEASSVGTATFAAIIAGIAGGLLGAVGAGILKTAFKEE